MEWKNWNEMNKRIVCPTAGVVESHILFWISVLSRADVGRDSWTFLEIPQGPRFTHLTWNLSISCLFLVESEFRNFSKPKFGLFLCDSKWCDYLCTGQICLCDNSNEFDFSKIKNWECESDGFYRPTRAQIEKSCLVYSEVLRPILRLILVFCYFHPSLLVGCFIFGLDFDWITNILTTALK